METFKLILELRNEYTKTIKSPKFTTDEKYNIILGLKDRLFSLTIDTTNYELFTAYNATAWQLFGWLDCYYSINN